MLKLIALIIETGITVGITYLISGIINPLFKKERTQLLSKRHSRAFALFMWLILVILKLNSFYLYEGGIEYRRIPLSYPYEIQETEIGTYLLKNGSEIGLAAIDECDIAAFSLQKNKMIFQCVSPGKVKVFSFEDESLTETSVTEGITWTTFGKEYPIYHYFRVDLMIILVLAVLYVCMIFISTGLVKICRHTTWITESIGNKNGSACQTLL